MFIAIKPKTIIAVMLALIISLVVSLCLFKITSVNAVSKFNYTIVIDAGHGGRDAGCSGINTNAKESDLNLAIAKKLQKYLYDFGFNVVMTRETQDGLYSENVDNYKKDDMANREKIIKKSNADMIISIHLNSFSSLTENGAQSFYEESNPQSINLSKSIQNQLINTLPNARQNANKGDYYILKTKNIPCSLVECGFLSNPEEEQLLLTEEYQQKVAYAIFCGIIEYYNNCDNLFTSKIFDNKD